MSGKRLQRWGGAAEYRSDEDELVSETESGSCGNMTASDDEFGFHPAPDPAMMRGGMPEMPPPIKRGRSCQRKKQDGQKRNLLMNVGRMLFCCSKHDANATVTLRSQGVYSAKVGGRKNSRTCVCKRDVFLPSFETEGKVKPLDRLIAWCEKLGGQNMPPRALIDTLRRYDEDALYLSQMGENRYSHIALCGLQPTRTTVADDSQFLLLCKQAWYTVIGVVTVAAEENATKRKKKYNITGITFDQEHINHAVNQIGEEMTQHKAETTRKASKKEKEKAADMAKYFFGQAVMAPNYYHYGFVGVPEEAGMQPFGAHALYPLPGYDPMSYMAPVMPDEVLSSDPSLNFLAA